MTSRDQSRKRERVRNARHDGEAAHAAVGGHDRRVEGDEAVAIGVGAKAAGHDGAICFDHAAACIVRVKRCAPPSSSPEQAAPMPTPSRGGRGSGL